MIHMQVAKATAAIPAVKRTYELVHRLLLIGNDQCHIKPAIIAMLPTANIPVRRSLKDRGDLIQRPQMTPSIAVPVSYTHLRAHETPEHLVCRLLLEKK